MFFVNIMVYHLFLHIENLPVYVILLDGVKCKKKAIYCCGNLSCNNGICGTCVRNLNCEQKHFIVNSRSERTNEDISEDGEESGSDRSFERII